MISCTLKRRTSLLFVPVETAVSIRVRLKIRRASVTRIPTAEGRSRMTRNNVYSIGTSLPEAFRRPDGHHRETSGFSCVLGLSRQVMASLLATTPSTSPLAALLFVSPLLDDHVGGFRRGLSLVNPLPHSFAGMSIAQICILSKAMSDVQLKELPTLFHAPRVARQLESFVKPATNLTIADW